MFLLKIIWKDVNPAVAVEQGRNVFFVCAKACVRVINTIQ